MTLKASQLIIHQNEEVIKLASGAVKRALGPDARIIPQFNFEAATTFIKDNALPFSLFVFGADTPGSESSSGTSLTTAACDFIRMNQRAKTKIPMVVLATMPDPQLTSLVRESENAVVVQYDYHEIEACTRDLYAGNPVKSYLEVEITLNDGDSGMWRIEGLGPFPEKASGILQIRREDFNTLVEWSEAIPVAGDGWRKLLAAVGTQLDNVLFDNFTNDLATAFFSRRIEVGGTQKVRFLFTMGPTRHGALVEGLRERRQAANLWMLEAPITRQYNVVGQIRPLFMDDVSPRSKVNCLIINAHPAGPDKEKDKDLGQLADLGPLGEIGTEADNIRAILEEARDRGAGIGEIERVDLERDHVDRVQQVLSKIGSGSWHIVHFAGHSIMQGNKPALVLSIPTREVLSFESLATQLRLTQFLFLSGYRGTAQPFLNKAMEYSIPAILGFRWEVGALPGRLFTESFYRCLFNRTDPGFKSLEYACLSARRRTHEREPGANTWASPLLLTQLRDTN